jgi:hypothetical protein
MHKTFIFFAAEKKRTYTEYFNKIKRRPEKRTYTEHFYILIKHNKKITVMANNLTGILTNSNFRCGSTGAPPLLEH